MSDKIYTGDSVKRWRRFVLLGYVLLIVGASLTISLTVSYYQGKVETELVKHENRIFDYVNRTCKPVRSGRPN